MPRWAINTEDAELVGTSYTFSYSSTYLGAITDTQTITLSIWDKCEATDSE